MLVFQHQWVSEACWRRKILQSCWPWSWSWQGTRWSQNIWRWFWQGRHDHYCCPLNWGSWTIPNTWRDIACLWYTCPQFLSTTVFNLIFFKFRELLSGFSKIIFRVSKSTFTFALLRLLQQVFDGVRNFVGYVPWFKSCWLFFEMPCTAIWSIISHFYRSTRTDPWLSCLMVSWFSGNIFI